MSTLILFALVPYIASLAILWAGILSTKTPRISVLFSILLLWVTYATVCALCTELYTGLLILLRTNFALEGGIVALFLGNGLSLLLYFLFRRSRQENQQPIVLSKRVKIGLGHFSPLAETTMA